VTLRLGLASNQAKGNRVTGSFKNNRNRTRGRFRCEGRLRAGRGDNADVSPHQISCHRRKLFDAPFGPAIFDGDVLIFDETRFTQALAKCDREPPQSFGRAGVHEPDNGSRWLLRTHRHRPCRHSTSEQS
jgi:hypothetical protein